MKNLFIIFTVLGLLLTSTVAAQVPNKISYQGLLTTSSGTPVQDGSYELDFKIYNVPIGGSILFFENHPGVAVQRGTFNVILGYIPHLPLPDIFNQPLFVEITAMSGPGISTPITFSPRSELTSAPYSLAPWSTIGSNISFMNGNVGIGTTSPWEKLHVSGSTRVNSLLYLGDGLGSPMNNCAIEVYNGNLRFFNFNASPSDVMTIHNTGNVGIGTTSPLFPFHVQKSVPDIFVASIDNQNPTGYGLEIRTADGSASRSALEIYTNNTFRFAVKNNGYVGIGTPSPSHILDVQGVDPRIFVGTGGAAVGLALSHQGTAARRYDLLSTGGTDPIAAGRFTIRDITGGGLDRLVINSNGHVGIGTANPQGALDISSTTGAFVVPRMTTVQRDALTAVNGMIIYNTTTNQFNFRENGAWVTK